ncbi:MAG: hypothetical protein JST30_12890 [Armatimonadetes bacterium]|nr:hypothetical protein [Armatimonadota bacterium]
MAVLGFGALVTLVRRRRAR